MKLSQTQESDEDGIFPPHSPLLSPLGPRMLRSSSELVTPTFQTKVTPLHTPTFMCVCWLVCLAVRNWWLGVYEVSERKGFETWKRRFDSGRNLRSDYFFFAYLTINTRTKSLEIVVVPH